MEPSFPASRVSRQGEIINGQCLRVAGKDGIHIKAREESLASEWLQQTFPRI